ncbi:MAG: hypothetical protein IID32_01860 [Planctomycetes bacterium]|nr:hypothetical protein [Planctomycetota bacterium]
MTEQTIQQFPHERSRRSPAFLAVAIAVSIMLGSVFLWKALIQQAGIRFEAPVPLNCSPENINSLGLIETYETVLLRARRFLGAGTLPETPRNANLALLLAAMKINDLYMLLGNEAFADATDFTIGVFLTEISLPPSFDPQSIFSFQGQVPNPLAEELALLRGVDRVTDPLRDPDTNEILATVYNRLPWNFTLSDGQIAYANNYQVTNVTDARTRYPQGHGDAWGHYLTATKKFYDLLTTDFFTWVVSTEFVNVAGAAVPVGFEYERKFAAAAAAKARTGVAITNLVFRQRFNADPAQQDGYSDDDPQRAWGVVDWARRAGQAAYFDWMLANALLDDDDEDHEEGSIEKIDRTTVTELDAIASSFQEIQGTLNNADTGLNPLGLATNVVPFGVDPGAIESGQTHFDQVFDRATKQLGSAIKVFQWANENAQRLRQVQDNEVEFGALVDQTEFDFKGRLIELFGRPYPDDLGPGKPYPTGYDGPDIFHYDYVEPSELRVRAGLADNSNSVQFTGTFSTTSIDFDPDSDGTDELANCSDLGAADGSGAVCFPVIRVDFNASLDGFGLVKPQDWTSRRPEPGEIQIARIQMLQHLGELLNAIEAFEAQIDVIDGQIDWIESISAFNVATAKILNDQLIEVGVLGSIIAIAKTAASGFEVSASIAKDAADAGAQAVPKTVGAGLTIITDAIGMGIAAAIKSSSTVAGAGFRTAKAVSDGVANAAEAVLSSLSANTQLQIANAQGDLVITQEVGNLANMLGALPGLEIRVLIKREALNQAIGRYAQALGRGARLLEQRTAFRQRTARKITKFRYQDMAFRIFVNDALQKFRATFDLAARYAYLAARAYDYETNLLGTNEASGQEFLTRLVKERVLGKALVPLGGGSVPLPGPGLAGALASLSENFEVLRGQLGFNNSAQELRRMFSLRWENYRKTDTDELSGEEWRTVLNQGRVDIAALPEYQLFALPLDIAGPIPGIALRFSSEITPGKNFFGRPSRADELYPTTYFAVKLHRVGVRFEGFPGDPLNNQIECYLIPTGSDVMRVPTCTNPRIRVWDLLDQTMPVPNNISLGEFTVPDWMPWDGLAGGPTAMIQRRLYPTIPGRSLFDVPAESDVDMSFSLTGRSAWNTEWVLLIPGISLLGQNPEEGLDVFIGDGTPERPGVTDIKLIFDSYGYFGCTTGAGLAEEEPVGLLPVKAEFSPE